jgi:hypothetical protein
MSNKAKTRNDGDDPPRVSSLSFVDRLGLIQIAVFPRRLASALAAEGGERRHDCGGPKSAARETKHNRLLKTSKAGQLKLAGPRIHATSDQGFLLGVALLSLQPMLLLMLLTARTPSTIARTIFFTFGSFHRDIGIGT